MRPDQLALLRKLADAAGPALVGLVEDVARGRSLAPDEALRLKTIVAGELCRAGLGADDEPSQYGLELERLIDML